MTKFLSKTALLAIIACLLWSTAFAGIKIGLQYTPPIQFAGLRFFLAGLILIPLTGSFPVFVKTLLREWRTILMVSLFMTSILYTLFYLGISMIQGSLAAILVGAQPLFVALVAHFSMKNDTLSFRKIFSITLGVLGIVLIAAQKGLEGAAGMQQLLGIALLILSNICTGFGNVIVSRNSKGIAPITLSSWQLMIGGIFLFILSLFIEPFQGFVFPVKYYMALGWLSFLSAAALTIWLYLLQQPGVKVSGLNVWKFIIPIFGAIFSWIILPEEQPELIPVVGMIIIAISLVLYHRQSAKEA
jgi:drug/metabolite transporter (DMT)-like permease